MKMPTLNKDTKNMKITSWTNVIEMENFLDHLDSISCDTNVTYCYNGKTLLLRFPLSDYGKVFYPCWASFARQQNKLLTFDSMTVGGEETFTLDEMEQLDMKAYRNFN